MLKRLHFGLIVEDKSDYESVRVLIQRLVGESWAGVRFSKFLGSGHGKILNKCKRWAEIFKVKGCNRMILVHDLDCNELAELKSKILNELKNCPVHKYLICIPVKEIEAWFLSDPKALSIVFKFKKMPKVPGTPEFIFDPKKKIAEIVRKETKKLKTYYNTQHNRLLAEHLNMELVKQKCPSFVPFFDFVAG